MAHLTVEMWNCHSDPLADLPWGRSAIWSTNMNSNSKNLILPFRSTGRSTGGVDLPVDLPIWAQTVKIWNCHSHPLTVLLGGRSAKYEFPDILLCSSQRSFHFIQDQLKFSHHNASSNFFTSSRDCTTLDTLMNKAPGQIAKTVQSLLPTTLATLYASVLGSQGCVYLKLHSLGYVTRCFVWLDSPDFANLVTLCTI